LNVTLTDTQTKKRTDVLYTVNRLSTSWWASLWRTNFIIDETQVSITKQKLYNSIHHFYTHECAHE